MLGEFHQGPGESASSVRIKLDPSTQTGDLIDAAHIDRSKISGTTHDGESTYVEIFHTPQAAP
jgi:uncharacterized membrane-anchored protein